jgi:hypothetical protein
MSWRQWLWYPWQSEKKTKTEMQNKEFLLSKEQTVIKQIQERKTEHNTQTFNNERRNKTVEKLSFFAFLVTNIDYSCKI